jgi:osmotically-inducible protein OsmY
MIGPPHNSHASCAGLTPDGSAPAAAWLLVLQRVGDVAMSPQYNRSMTIAYNQHPLHDSSIARRAQERLHDSSFAALRRLTCDVHEGMLTLRGRLPNFYTKQVALSLVGNIEGVEEITDRVEVV